MKYMMATKAFHKLGDVSSDTPDLCQVFKMDKKYYYGHWVEGYGLNVRFPKKTTKYLTKEQVKYYKNKSVIYRSGVVHRLNIK